MTEQNNHEMTAEQAMERMRRQAEESKSNIGAMESKSNSSNADQNNGKPSAEERANSTKNNASDMNSAMPGSQRNTNQPDSDDLDDESMPAPGTGDTAAGLATDGRGRQKVKGEVVDHVSGDPNGDNAQGNLKSGETAASRAAGVSGMRAIQKQAGISKDIRDKMDKPVWIRRLIGTEEVLVQANRATLRVLDRNGRPVEIGNVVNLQVRVIGINSAQEIEVVYPPYIPVVEEVPTNEAGQLKNSDGTNYTGGLYKLDENNQVVNVNTNEPPVEDEQPKQEQITVQASQIERF